MTETQTLESEVEVYKKKFSRWMDSWRELALTFRSILLWDKPAYPWILAILISIFFMELAYLDPSMVTALSLGILIWLVIDYTVPLVSSALWPAGAWTAIKQKDLDETAASLASALVQVISFFRSIRTVKANHPTKYFSIAIACLMFFSWIGSTVNNLFITYIFVMSVAMAPGLKKSGCADQYLEASGKMVADLIRKLNRPKLE